MSTCTSPYRNATNEVQAHADRLLAARVALDDGELRRIYRFRIARIGFGVAGSLGGLVTALVLLFAENGQIDTLRMSWTFAILSGLLSYVWAQWHYRTLQEAVPQDPYQVVMQYGDSEPEPVNLHAWKRVQALELSSFRWPLMAGAMLMPLSLAMLALGSNDPRVSLDFFCRAMGAFTAHVHAYAIFAAWQFPKKRNHLRIVAIASLLALVPFALPVLAVLPIAMFIVCCYFAPLGSLVDREKGELDGLMMPA